MKTSRRWATEPFVLSIFLAFAAPLPAQVAITEIMYDAGPSGEEGRQREFIEIFNITPEPIDLSGWYFSKGIDYTFPDDKWIEAGSYLVVAADPTWLRSTYSLAAALVLGPWDASTALDNGGETIAISDAAGAEIVRVKYNDRGSWPAAADGTGHSLQIESPYKEGMTRTPGTPRRRRSAPRPRFRAGPRGRSTPPLQRRRSSSTRASCGPRGRSGSRSTTRRARRSTSSITISPMTRGT
jgi:hypothetical protein